MNDFVEEDYGLKEKTAILTMDANGKTISEIAKTIGLSNETIKRVIRSTASRKKVREKNNY